MARQLTKKPPAPGDGPRAPRARAAPRAAVQLERLERLQRLTAALSAALTVEDVAQLIIAEGFGLIPARSVFLHWEREPGELDLVYAFGVSEEFAGRFRRLRADDRIPVADAYRTGEPVWLRSRAEIAQRYPELAQYAGEEDDVASVALPVGAGRAKGTLGLLFDASREFEPDEREFVLAVARQCAQALERARLFAAQKQLADRIAGLQEATAAFSAAATTPAVTTAAFRALGRLGVKSGAIVYETQPDHLAIVHQHELDAETAALLARLIVVGGSPISDAFHRGEEAWLTDGEAVRARYPDLADVFARRQDGAWVALPLAIQERRVGVLAFALPQDRAVDAADRAYAVALAQQCAQALERSRAYESQKRLAEQVSALHSTAAALSGASAPKEIAEHVFRSLASMGASAVELHVTEPPDRVALLVRHGPAAGARSAPVPVDAPLPAAEVVRTGKALWLESPEEIGTRFPEMEPIRRWRGEGAWAVVPLLAGGRTLGALVAAFPAARRFDADERTFLRALAQPCAQAVERTRVYEAAAAEQAEAERYAAMLEETFDGAPIGLGLLDTDLAYVRANRRLAELHGIAPAAHRGNTPAALLPGPAGEAIVAACRKVLETGEPVHDVGIVGETAADPGTTRRWTASVFPVHANGKVSGVGIVVREARA